MRAVRDVRAGRGEQRAILLRRPDAVRQQGVGIERAEFSQMSDRGTADPRPGALDREVRFRAMQVQPGAVGARKLGAGTHGSVAAAFQVVQADPDAHAALAVVVVLKEARVLLQSGRKRLGVGHIRHDGGADADVTRRRQRRFGPDAHVNDAGRSGQHRLRVGRKRTDIGLLVGEPRLLTLDHPDPTFERKALGAAAGEARMRVGVGVDEAGQQGPATRPR